MFNPATQRYGLWQQGPRQISYEKKRFVTTKY